MTYSFSASEFAEFLAVIDGPVGVGKTTVTTLAAARLATDGLPVLATRHPQHLPSGKLPRAAVTALITEQVHEARDVQQEGSRRR